LRKLQNLEKDQELTERLRQAGKASQLLNEADLRTIVSIESTANRQTGKNKFGYAGLFQLGKGAAKDAGYDFKKLDEPSEWRTNVDAGVRYLEINAQRLRKAGMEVNPLNVYLAHQQGPTGAIGILQAVQDGSASEKPANKNQLNNLPQSLVKAITQSGRKVTVEDYYSYWSEAFRTVSEQVNKTMPTPAGGSTPLP
jgi:hypothetical protein